MKVNETDPRVAAMVVDWDLIETLLGGTRAMREARERYLPRWSLEDQRDYDARLKLSTLFPALEQTVREMTGRVFGEEVTPDKGTPDWILSEVWQDIDRLDANGHVFAREWWRKGLSFGLSLVLVEGPPPGQFRSQAEQKEAKARPYCILIEPKRVLGWKTRDGKLTQLRLTWSRTEDSEFGEKTVEQVRVYEIDATGFVVVRTFEKTERDGKAEWPEILPPVVTEQRAIPVAVFYTGKTGTLTAVPPLRELAYLNAKHWTHQSGIDALQEITTVPLLAIIGADDEQTTITVGAKSALRLPPGADAKYVEHSGSAIGTGRQALLDLEAQMKAIGAKLIEPGAGTKTATQAGEDAASANSVLGGWVRDFADAMASLLDVIASYRGDEKGGKVKISADLDPDVRPVESMQVLSKMRAQGDLSGETLFREGQRRGLISPEIEWEDEQARIETEGPKPADPDPAARNTGGAP